MYRCERLHLSLKMRYTFNYGDDSGLIDFIFQPIFIP